MAHDVAHEPHRVSVFTGVSHPLAGLLSQLPKPAAQTGEQRPLTHEFPVVSGLVAHMFPQPPQWLALVSPLTQAPPQLISGAAQHSPIEHAPVRHAGIVVVQQLCPDSPHAVVHPMLPPPRRPHVAGAVHEVPHAPQWAAVFSGVSQPLARLPSQSS